MESHPVWYTAVVSAASAVGGSQFIPWLQTKGVDWIIQKASDLQEARERKAGLTPAQMKIIAEHEAAVAQRAADDLKKRAELLASNEKAS